MAEMAALAAFVRGLRIMTDPAGKPIDQRQALADKLGTGTERLLEVERGGITTMHERRGWAKALGMTCVGDFDVAWRGNVRPEAPRTDVEDERLIGTKRKIPICNLTPAGEPADFVPHTDLAGCEGRMHIDAPEEIEGTEDVFGAIVIGDSMEPRWKQGDLILCRAIGPEDEQKDGTPCHVRLTVQAGGGCSFRLVYRDLDVMALELRPTNPSHRSKFYPFDEVQQVSPAIHEIKDWHARHGRGSFDIPW